MSLLAPTLQAWFTERLITQPDSSPQTIASYRDTFRLLLGFASGQTGKQPFELDIDDHDAPLIVQPAADQRHQLRHCLQVPVG
jgi:integrase/recombinase XerD